MVDELKFIMERGKHEVLSMFGYRENLGQFFKGPCDTFLSSLIYSNMNLHAP